MTDSCSHTYHKNFKGKTGNPVTYPTHAPKKKKKKHPTKSQFDVCKKNDGLCGFITVILPEDAAQSRDGGDAVSSAAAPLFSASRLFGPSRTSDTYRSSSCQTQRLLLPEEGRAKMSAVSTKSSVMLHLLIY